MTEHDRTELILNAVMSANQGAVSDDALKEYNRPAAARLYLQPNAGVAAAAGAPPNPPAGARSQQQVVSALSKLWDSQVRAGMIHTRPKGPKRLLTSISLTRSWQRTPMDEKPLPIACCACCYSCDCNRPALEPTHKEYHRRQTDRTKIAAQNRANEAKRYSITMAEWTTIFTMLKASTEETAPVLSRQLKDGR